VNQPSQPHTHWWCNGRRDLSHVHPTPLPLTLKTGDRVMRDNLAVHKVAGVRTAIERAGAHLLYLSPYSPRPWSASRLRPIELAFSKLKDLRHVAKERAVTDVWDRIDQSLTAFSPEECRDYLAHQRQGSTRSENIIF